MKTLFEIGTMSDGGTAPVLMELGSGHCLLAQWNRKLAQPYFVRLWSFMPDKLSDTVRKVLEITEAADINGAEIAVGAAFPQTMLLPEGLDVDGNALMQTLYGVPEADIHHHSQQQNLFYTLPQSVKVSIGNSFSKVSFLPAAACLLSNAEEPATAPYIKLLFIHNLVQIATHYNNQVQLLQQYQYSAPLDIVYYLLKIITEFGYNQEETVLELSGFIADGSALHRELLPYFANIRFASDGIVLIDGDEVPQYYFSSLYNLAACAL